MQKEAFLSRFVGKRQTTVMLVTPVCWRRLLTPWRYQHVGGRTNILLIFSINHLHHPSPWSLWYGVFLKWGASSWWSSSLYCPMRNSDQITIWKTHPTLDSNTFWHSSKWINSNCDNPFNRVWFWSQSFWSDFKALYSTHCVFYVNFYGFFTQPIFTALGLSPLAVFQFVIITCSF